MKKYKSIIFDCDGVILNSNKIKTETFRNILRGFQENAIEEFINYHQNNGGISRYIKLDYFLTNILPKYSKFPEDKENILLSLLTNYSNECKECLYKSEVADNLEKLKTITNEIPWIIVSGSDQKELRDVFDYKKLSKFFNGGIFGSPEKKFDIINREKSIGFIKYPALFLGDSKLDHAVAKSLNIDFLFVSNWTDFRGYASYCRDNSVETINSVSELIDIFKKF